MALRKLLVVVSLALVLPGVAHAGLLGYQGDRRLAPATVPAAGGDSMLVMVAPRDGYATGQVAVTSGGGMLQWGEDAPSALRSRTSFALVAQTRVRGRLVSDPLPPVSGGAVPGPAVVFVRVETHGLAAGLYRGTLWIGQESIPVALTVSSWAMPSRTEGFRTLFLVQPQTYFERVDPGNALRAAQQGNRAFFDLLSRYRIAPGDWGYGSPTPSGYVEGGAWHARRATLMRTQAGPGFNTLRIPLSTQHQAGQAWLGKASPYAPAAWKPWLSLVRPFWQRNGWTDRAVAWTWDEPGPKESRLVAQQATALHAGFPEAKVLSTVSPLPGNRYLRDGGADDLDVWAVLARRFYGTYGRPRAAYGGIREVRARGKELWSYTYHGVAGSPGFDATEPLTDTRMFFAWNAIEGTAGTLYSDGLARYKRSDPWQALPDDGQSVFLYPGTPARPAPVPSLRLEALRDGVQDADLFLAYARVYGRAGLVRLLAQHGLFRATPRGELQLGCTSGCELRTLTKYAWPVWQRDEAAASTGLFRARTQALFTLGASQPPAR
jgi:hypothetical protein